MTKKFKQEHMSKIGRQPIIKPFGVDFEISGDKVKVTGPKGSLSYILPRGIKLEEKEGSIIVSKLSGASSALHGTTRANLSNMVHGVTEGWHKDLEIIGTGYRAEVNGKTLVLTVGFSHPVKHEAPEGIEFKVEKMVITVSGIDKQLVGKVAADIRSTRPPEPYKGKGIKYTDEVIRRKVGKAAKAAGAAA